MKTKQRNRKRKTKAVYVATEGSFTARVFEVRTKTGIVFSSDYRWGGKRHRRAFADFELAKAAADAAARRMATGESQALNLTGQDATLYVMALEKLKPTGIPFDVAIRDFVESVNVLGANLVLEAARDFAKRNLKDIPRKTVAEVKTALVDAKIKAILSKRYVQDLESRCGMFAEAFKCPLLSVTADDICGYLDRLDAAPRTFKNHYNAIRTLLDFAKARKWLAKDHDLLDGIELPKDIGGKIEVFNPKEIDLILANADKDILPAIAIGAFAGLRSAEIERLSWSEVHLVDRFIEVSAGKAKTASRRLVPISNNLVAWLTPYAGRLGKVWTGEHFDFYNSQHDAAAKAGIAWKANALRHSWISYRLAEIQDAAKVALEAGNSPQMIFRHYRELVRPADAVAWFGVSPKQPENVTMMDKPADAC